MAFFVIWLLRDLTTFYISIPRQNFKGLSQGDNTNFKGQKMTLEKKFWKKIIPH